MVKADVVFDVRSPVTSLGVLRRGLDDPEAVLASVEAGFLHELPSTVLGSLLIAFELMGIRGELFGSE